MSCLQAIQDINWGHQFGKIVSVSEPLVQDPRWCY